jgi:protein-L-isoaspartate(D-aspartate) O-methyltransferase
MIVKIFEYKINNIISEILDFQVIIMNFNFQKARELMVENQLRPNKINDPTILELFKSIKKEDFLPEKIKKYSYNDLDTQLSSNRGYLKNLHIAQLIHNANIVKKDKILHIGGMTGYVSVILSSLCKELIIIENEIDLIFKIEENIKNLNIKNATIINAPFQKGFNKKSPYDIIFIDNPIKEMLDAIKKQVSSNSGRIIMIKKINPYLCKAYKITNNSNIYTNEFLFDVFTKYELYKNETNFIF